MLFFVCVVRDDYFEVCKCVYLLHFFWLGMIGQFFLSNRVVGRCSN